MVEHTAWIGPDYGRSDTSLGGHRVAIVGYSHWCEEGWKDTNEATIDCIRKVMSGCLRRAFFTGVRNYFDYDNHKAFWLQVTFFNYLPNCVGSGTERYNAGTPEQLSRAEGRLKRLIQENQPDKVVVFTSKSRDFPPTDSQPQAIPGFPMFKWGTYSVGGHIASAFFLRHPQGAHTELMRSAVKYILGLPNARSGPK